LFARPETCLFYFYVKSTAVGAILFFMSAGPAGADSATVVMDVGWQPNENSAAKHKDDIAKRPRAKKPIAKPKTAAGIGCAKKIKKTWMMHLQHGYQGGVCSYLTLSGTDFLLSRTSDSVIFVQQMVWWWMNFPAVAMVRQGIGHDQEKNFGCQPN
jgi:hypothetical protein